LIWMIRLYMRFCGILSLLGPTCLAAPTTGPATQTAGAAAPESSISVEQKRQLLAALSSDQWSVREAATRRIIAMGEGARPLIAELLKMTDDAEAKARLKLALEQIGEARISGPSLISIHMKGASPREAFAAVARQCYAKLPTSPQDLFHQQWPSFNIDIDRKPFWEAIGALSAQTGVHLGTSDEGFALMRDDNLRSGQRFVSGAFLVVANEVNHERRIAVADGSSYANFGVKIFIYAEPKLRVLAADELELVEAADNRGTSLLPDAGFSLVRFMDKPTAIDFSRHTWRCTINLKYPDRPGSAIAHVRGSTSFVVQGGSLRVDLRGLASLRQKPQKTGGLTILIKELKQNGGAYELKMSVRHDLLDSRWSDMNTAIDGLKITDAAGHVYSKRESSWLLTPLGIDITTTLAPPAPLPDTPVGEPFELSWEIPMAGKQVRVPFEFSNLPIP